MSRSDRRGVFHQRSADRIDNVVWFLEHISVPEPDYATAVCLQPSRADFVVEHLRIRRMRFAVEFDDQPRLGTEEIGNVWPDGRLPPEAIA